MLEPAVIAVRLLQYVAAMILCGSSLFFCLTPALRQVRGARAMVVAAGTLLAVTALLSIAAQASLFAGSFTDGLTRESMEAVVSYMPLGKAAIVRAAAAVTAAIGLLAMRRDAAWRVAAVFGTLAAASLAWMGHGGATEGALGWVHLGADMLHALAAAIWLGALAAFALVLLQRDREPAENAALHRALHNFSGVGTALVVTLGLTGVVNSWLLVGPGRLLSMTSNPYGQLLLTKLAVFVVMLGLAAHNRFRLTPALGDADKIGQADAAITALRRSILAEAMLGLTVLALVTLLGTLAPPASV